MIQAKLALANTFFMYFKAHSYHWNVEGKDFPQLHEFFGGLYDELYGAVDPLAEHIRTLGEYAPRNIEELWEHKSIDASNKETTARGMVSDLLETNDQVIISLNILFKELQTKNKQGFMNFIADRIDAHEKHGWMLRSILKGTGE